MEPLEKKLAALKAKKARMLAKVNAEIQAVEKALADEAAKKRRDVVAARRAKGARVMEMREAGKTFRQIAVEVGCSEYKAREIARLEEGDRWKDEYEARMRERDKERARQLDAMRTVTVVINSPVTVDGFNYGPGAQVRVTPLVAGNIVASRRGGFATEDDYEAFLVAYPGERKTK